MKRQKPKQVISQGICCGKTLQVVPFHLKTTGFVSVTDQMGDPVQSSKLKVSNSETIVRKLNALFYSRKYFVNLWYKLQSTVTNNLRERSGSVVECLTRDRRVAGSSLTGVTALWSLSKTHLS